MPAQINSAFKASATGDGENWMATDVTNVKYEVLLDDNISPDIFYGYGDPCVTRIVDPASPTGYEYYLTATSNDAPDSFPLLKSSDLKNWTHEGFIFPSGRKPQWTKDGANVSDFWAGEIHQVGNKFLFCYCARDEQGTLSIGIEKADRPEGPYSLSSTPLIGGGVIDPHIVVDNNHAYLLWKEDNNDIWPSLLVSLLNREPDLVPLLFPKSAERDMALDIAARKDEISAKSPMARAVSLSPLIDAVTADFADFKGRLAAEKGKKDDLHRREQIEEVFQAMRTPFLMQELDPDTLTLIGAPRVTIENDQEWEAHLIEGMFVAKKDDWYYMVYAGNDFATEKYAIGVASARSLEGPWVKQAEPLARSTADWAGPGHPSITRDMKGNPVLVMHGFVPGAYGYKIFRALLATPLHLQDGKACINKPEGGMAEMEAAACPKPA